MTSEITNIWEKCIRVIKSCETTSQFETACRYMDFADIASRRLAIKSHKHMLSYAVGYASATTTLNFKSEDFATNTNPKGK